MFDPTSSLSLWTQFRAAYPTASLISELLQIHEQQYVVRVQIECGNLVLATGLSADRHLEKAEDRARERAIALLQPPSRSASPAPIAVQPTPVEAPVELTPVQPTPPPQPSPPKPAPAQPEIKAPEPEPWSPVPPLEDDPEDYADQPLPSPPAPEPEEGEEGEEEFDFSDISLKIDMELKHIGWNSKRESDYLKRIYGKNKRMILGDEEMKEFLEYLQTYAQTDVELKKVGWSAEQGKDYLKSQYPDSQGSRLMLTCSQIKEFLHHLQQTGSSGDEFF
ncbi:hypothetical protein [Roseofilum capinflatum]|uniref:Uncharacterized protein n=1 Tax=Roseofilum capinflatum BLCC-M114 TaxID=3022440 RepID=A0ABT7BBZ8_9CYAN|nr:hypothetical protein [Roseofilum capinflatum]MDJ1176709.1 hypothetical protein [Roseofilum capinflatum BLCC-M114]